MSLDFRSSFSGLSDFLQEMKSLSSSLGNSDQNIRNLLASFKGFVNYLEMTWVLELVI